MLLRGCPPQGSSKFLIAAAAGRGGRGGGGGGGQEARVAMSRQQAGPRAASTSGCASPEDKPLFSWGVLSDIQYADRTDGHSFHGVPRFYRASLEGLKRAVSAWAAQDLSFVAHLGDILDGSQDKQRSRAVLDALVAEFERVERPHRHALGNHCLYNLDREVLNERLGMAGPGGESFYAFSPHPAWRVVVLDGYDVSLLGRPPGDPRHALAQDLLARHNPNENKNDPEPMEGAARRFVMFGGGVSADQLAWLRGELSAARSEAQRVVVLCHLPLQPGTCPGTCLLWNYEEVLAAIHEAGNVVATFTGHAHKDGYMRDERGVHHRVLKAVLETPAGRDCYGVVHHFGDRLELEGVDTLASTTMPFPEALPGRTFGQDSASPGRALSGREAAEGEAEVLERNVVGSQGRARTQ